MSPEYVPAVIITLVVVVGVIALILLGWRNRQRRQASVPAPASIPETLSEPRVEVEGTYVVTTSAGDRLDRIAVHQLGLRGPALLSVGSDGVAVLREGNPNFFVPSEALELVDTTSNMVGKAVEKDGIVVLRHTQDGFGFDTGFRPRYHEQKAELLSALRALVPAGTDTTGKDSK
ncbi:PH-like domain-containing protein [Galactobacter valiniphilus]|uniref:PH domain-containing protein n=1 Tax=Galactobacter valiniphilus TaxID=2676122 RepID=A0A399JKT7_9MICC|nr:hypothetical protein [Galactobacter valiniphilus]RII43136.1 hypothetical protein DWB68_03645 [Galactobacter valiniphilus]